MALVMLVAMGGGALLSLGLEKKGGAAEVCEDGVVATSGGGGMNCPCFPCL